MLKGPTVEVRCGCCGKLFTKRQSDYLRATSGRVFCSAACRRKIGPKPRTGDSKPCAHCGSEFYAPPASPGRKQAQFCNFDCFLEAARVARIECACMVCGKPFELKPSQMAFRGGDPTKVTCSKRCDAVRRTRNGIGRFHNGREVVRRTTGYLLVYEPDHPTATKEGWVLEHRWIAEQRIGRYLTSKEHVHHVNGIKDDNRSENLVVLSHSEHSKLSNKERLDDIAAMRSELEEYRRRVGPLE